MLFKIIIKLLFGYKNIKIEGYYIEKFLNIITNRKIFLWGIKRKGNEQIYAKVGDSEFDKIIDIAEKNGINIEIINEKGLPNILKKYKKRKYFFILIAIFLVFLGISSNFIWNIEITGNEKINKDEILKMANDYGLKIGMMKSKIETKNIINKIRMNREDIAWIGIDFKGTNAIIKVVEAKEKPEIIDEKDYTNIVAKKDAIITKISAQNGTILKNVNDEVKKGDVLIAGYMQGNYTDKYYVHSIGEVKGKVKYSDTEKILKSEIIKNKTGKKEKKYSLKFNKIKINLYKKYSKYKKYDTIVTEKNLKLFNNFYLPIEIIKYENEEVNENEITNSKEDAKNKGELMAKQKLEDNLKNNEIVNSDTIITEYDNYYEVKVTYEVIEDIATNEKIVF